MAAAAVAVVGAVDADAVANEKSMHAWGIHKLKLMMLQLLPLMLAVMVGTMKALQRVPLPLD